MLMHKMLDLRWGLGFVCAKISAKLKMRRGRGLSEDSNLCDHADEETALGVQEPYEQRKRSCSGLPGSPPSLSYVKPKDYFKFPRLLSSMEG